MESSTARETPAELSLGRRWLHRLYAQTWRVRGSGRVVNALAGAGRPDAASFVLPLGASRLIVPSASVGVPRDLFTTGVHETLSSLLLRALVPGRTFYDVGANIGYFTILAADAGAREVIAFEPFPPNLSYLERNLALNPSERVRLFPCALGAESGELALHAGESFGDGPVSATTAVSDRVVATPRVERLDDLRDREDFAGPDVAKLDIEGYEPYAIAGMRAALAECEPMLVIELNDKLLRAAGSSQRELADTLASAGYAHLLDLDGRAPRPIRFGRTLNAFAVTDRRWPEALPVLRALGYREP